MSSKGDALVARVQSSYRQLAAAANNLNNVSDQLGETIAELDGALKKLNIGISAWVSVSISHYEQDPTQYEGEELGYAKIAGKWGIGIRTISGDEDTPFGLEETIKDQWHFNDAPRDLRLRAIDKIPELFERLTTDANASAQRIQQKLAHAKQLAAAIDSAGIDLEGYPPSISVLPVQKSEKQK